MLCLHKSQPEYYTDQIIKGLTLILLMSRTDTSSITLEWAMFNVLNHPYILNKAKVEMNNLLGHGREQRIMDESDISKLPYLRSIISETLQLYPPGPLLAPHFSSGDCTTVGFDIPRDTILLVNVWAIHRDPKPWEDAKSFKPENLGIQIIWQEHPRKAYSFVSQVVW
ncbi:hypothetical protein L3X38_034217 [Prunus dulcis]|uniref:Uncharacterized protein n=1 Tax=Prunus dulcis TaxID=3755 RepID=A0AAD4VHP1_PRUDU|nr:hypothetical protein L3X38_034217 [Prunus dulcis]